MNLATTPLFTPNPSAGQPKTKIVRGNAIERYNEALEYLRIELSINYFKVISSAELANTFKISHSFLAVVASLGAVERRYKKKTFHYRATSKLLEIDGKKVLDEKRVLFPNKPKPEVEKVAEKVEPPKDIPTTHLAVEATTRTVETYLIGVVENGVLTVDISNKFTFEYPEDASNQLRDFSCESGQKLALLKVIEVVEPVRVFQSSTL
ncbi:hypothetical protein [Spirosoma litoris]